MQIGQLTANLLGPVEYSRWMTNALESATLYSWAQNNHWHTNYKIDQPGVTTFKYAIRPHKGGYSAAEAARFGHVTTRPLIVSPSNGRKAGEPLLRISSDRVLVETIKPSDDGKAVILRLFGAGGKAEQVKIQWQSLEPASVWLTDLSEKPLKPAPARILVPGYGVTTIRAKL